jgi:adenosylcobinamide-GDP ribazoletransferase
MGKIPLEFLVALQFLTVAPPVLKRELTPLELGRGTAFFPLVGLLIGALLLGANLLFDRFFPAPVRAGLVLAAWIGMSGALHLDGFLDACDGLLGGFTPESRLEIMKDERERAFALAGGVLLRGLKFAALSALPLRPAALLLAPTLGRWAMCAAIYAFPYARERGLGKAMKDHTTSTQVGAATFLTLGIVLAAGIWSGQMTASLAAAGLAALTLLLAARFTLRRIPGLTGDIYGAINELVELVVLLFFTARGLTGS